MNIKIGRSMGGSKMKQIQAVQLTKGLVQIESTSERTIEITGSRIKRRGSVAGQI